MSAAASMESRRLLSVSALSRNQTGGNSQFVRHSEPTIGTQNTNLSRKVTPTGDDEIYNAPFPPGGVQPSQANLNSNSLSDAIEQYEIARLNLEAQFKARKAAEDLAVSARIKRDFVLTDSFRNGKRGMTNVSPPSLSRKQTISAKNQSIGLDKILQSTIETQPQQGAVSSKPHRTANGYHGTLCLKSNLVEEDEEEEDDTTLHVGFSDQWDDALMAKAMHESKMMALAQSQHEQGSISARKLSTNQNSTELNHMNEEDLVERAIEESKRIAANQEHILSSQQHKNTQDMMLSNFNQDKKPSVTGKIRASSWSSHEHDHSRETMPSNPPSAVNGHFSQLGSSDFALQNQMGHSKINGNSIRMDHFVNDYQAKLRQAGVDQANATLQSLLPLRAALGLSDPQVPPLNLNSIASMLGELPNNPMVMHSMRNPPMVDMRLHRPSVLQQLLQIQNFNPQDVESILNSNSNLGYSAGEMSLLMKSGLQQGSFQGNNDSSISSHRNSLGHGPLQGERQIDNFGISRDEVNLVKKRPNRNLSCTCFVCRKLFSAEKNESDQDFVCRSCFFLRNKKARPDYSGHDSTSTDLLEGSILAKKFGKWEKFGKWDIIPSHTLILLAADDDTNWLSDLLCFLRRQIEVFTATPDDVSARSRRGGIKQPIAVGRVGIRCIHCGHINPDDRAKGAVSYPNSIRIVHQAIRNWQRYHFMQCVQISEKTKKRYFNFKTTRSHSGNASLKYWVTSCQKLGMVDTDPKNGIRYLDPRKSGKKSFDSLTDTTSAKKESLNEGHQFNKLNSQNSSRNQDIQMLEDDSNDGTQIAVPFRKLPDSLLEPGDEFKISPFLILLLSQQQPTHYTSIDKLGKRKSRPINFTGVECRHCSSRVAGSGRYFPLTVTTFANNNNPNNCIHIHMMKCTRCPQKIKEEFVRLQYTNVTDGLKLENGWKKKFFDRLWVRLHGKRCVSTQANSSEVVNRKSGTNPNQSDVGSAAIALSCLHEH